MNYIHANKMTGFQWAIIWLVGIITFLAIAAWPENAYPSQAQVSDAAESAANIEMTDEQIVVALRKKASIDGIDTTDVQTFSTHGIVTLDGEVSSIADKLHVRRIASGIRGVRGVVNQLNVKPSSLTDAQVRNAITDQLSLNTATDAYEIIASVNEGKVKLTGSVESLAEKQLAERVVSELRGVRAIESEIEIHYSDHRSDGEIRTEIAERLTNDVWIDEQMIAVDVVNGKVRLRGKVATAGLKDRLGILVLTTGVQSFDVDDVQVDPSLSIVPKKRQPSTRLDFEIRKALFQSLRLDPRVDLGELEMTVDSGVVLLEGTVGDFQSKRAAVDTARNVVGVSDVIDNLEIENTTAVADEVIQNQLVKAFDRTATLKYDKIKVQVESGIVKLRGTVPSQYQRRRAESVADSLAGVLEVNNEIAIDNPRSDRSDLEIGSDIERGIRWSPYLNITKLEYSVNDGVVTFTGTVANQQSLDLALANAIDAGARDVVSKDVKIE